MNVRLAGRQTDMFIRRGLCTDGERPCDAGAVTGTERGPRVPYTIYTVNAPEFNGAVTPPPLSPVQSFEQLERGNLNGK